MTKFSKKYDLEERTAKFGENVIELCGNIDQKNTVAKPIISQLVRSAASIGANYMEANAASSRRDFRNKIFICKKEAHETKHWLRMLAKCFPEDRDKIGNMWKEVQELTLIFQKITSSIDKLKIQ